MTATIRAIAAFCAVAIMSAGCVIIVDKDDDGDGKWKSDVTVRSIGSYDTDSDTDEKND